MDDRDCPCLYCERVRFLRETNRRSVREDFFYYQLVPGLAMVTGFLVWMFVMFK